MIDGLGLGLVVELVSLLGCLDLLRGAVKYSVEVRTSTADLICQLC